jgi:hypothetical protein
MGIFNPNKNKVIVYQSLWQIWFATKIQSDDFLGVATYFLTQPKQLA